MRIAFRHAAQEVIYRPWKSNINTVYEYGSIRVPEVSLGAGGSSIRAGGTHLDMGVMIGGDRAAAERVATYAIELLKQQKREWSPELPAGA